MKKGKDPMAFPVKRNTIASEDKKSIVPESPKYEKNRWPYYVALVVYIPMVLWVILKKSWYGILNRKINMNHMLFDGVGKINREVKEGSRSWKALDLIYNYQFGLDNSLSGKIQDFWGGMLNAQAVRNRAKLARLHLRNSLLSFSQEKSINLISLACGSAQAVIETVAELKNEGLTVRVLLIDQSADALDYARLLAERYGVIDQIQMVQGDVFHIKRFARNFHPHVIEMLGLMDYLGEREGSWLVRHIRESLVYNGKFLTANIRHNIEMFVVHHLMNWPMIYRRRGEFARLIEKGGFEKSDYSLDYEPIGIHGVVVATKRQKED